MTPPSGFWVRRRAVLMPGRRTHCPAGLHRMADRLEGSKGGMQLVRRPRVHHGLISPEWSQAPASNV